MKVDVNLVTSGLSNIILALLHDKASDGSSEAGGVEMLPLSNENTSYEK